MFYGGTIIKKVVSTKDDPASVWLVAFDDGEIHYVSDEDFVRYSREGTVKHFVERQSNGMLCGLFMNQVITRKADDVLWHRQGACLSLAQC